MATTASRLGKLPDAEASVLDATTFDADFLLLKVHSKPARLGPSAGSFCTGDIPNMVVSARASADLSPLDSTMLTLEIDPSMLTKNLTVAGLGMPAGGFHLAAIDLSKASS